MEVSLRPDALKGHVEGLVLAVLSDGPSHGYAIMEALSAKTGGAVSLEGGTLYPVLRRMEDAGLVSGRWSEHAGRRRRTYALTAKGRTAIKAERSAWEEFVSLIGAVMIPESAG